MFWEKKKKMRDKFELNPKGIYSTRYVINKYINEEEVDTIAAYEELINNCQEKLEQAKYYDFIKKIDPEIPIENEEVKHLLAALMHVSITLKVLIPEERQKCLQLITNEERRKRFEESLNSKMFQF